MIVDWQDTFVVLFHGYMTAENINILSLLSETAGVIFSYFIFKLSYSFHDR
jgi:hypothetical protein